MTLLLLLSCGPEIDCCVLPPTTEAFAEVEAKGCSSFYVYKEDPKDFLHIYVQGDRDALGLDLSEKRFELEDGLLEVKLLKFDGEIGNYACDDVANDQGEIIKTWTATEGTAFIRIVEDRITVTEWEMTYKMTVVLENVLFKNATNDITVLDRVVFEDVLVGWLPG